MEYRTTMTLIVFVLTYAGVATGHVWGLKLDRTGIVLLGGIALLALECVTLNQAVQFVNYPSILMLFGFFVLSAQLRMAGFYDWVARSIARSLDQPKQFLLILMVASGVLSAFLNNDIVCFAFAPVITVALLRKQLNPLPFLIALAVSSNIGCAATLIGNAQDILVGQVAHLSFGHYMLWALPPVIASMAAAFGIIWLTARQDLHLTTPVEFSAGVTPTPLNVWHTIKGLSILVVVIMLFFTSLPREIVVLVAAGIHLASHTYESKKMLSLVDWQILLLFIGLFVVVGTFTSTGLGEKAVQWFSQRGLNLHNPYALTLTTGVLSNLINNSAAVMLLIHLVDLSHPLTGYLLALGNTLAGNLLLIGSVANIIVAQQAAEYGVNLSFQMFARYGIPITAASYTFLLLWIVLMT